MPASGFVLLLSGMSIDSGSGQTLLIPLSVINTKVVNLIVNTELLLLFSGV